MISDQLLYIQRLCLNYGLPEQAIKITEDQFNQLIEEIDCCTLRRTRGLAINPVFNGMVLNIVKNDDNNNYDVQEARNYVMDLEPIEW